MKIEVLKRQIDGAIGKQIAGDGGEPMAPWTMHDLRRSLVTGMNDRGLAQPHVIKAIVNHISGHRGGIAGIYNWAVYMDERRRALEAWAKLITSPVADSNVVHPRYGQVARHVFWTLLPAAGHQPIRCRKSQAVPVGIRGTVSGVRAPSPIRIVQTVRGIGITVAMERMSVMRRCSRITQGRISYNYGSFAVWPLSHQAPFYRPRSSRNSDAGSTPLIIRRSRARVQAT
jgi:hypothetical protein